MLCLKYIIEFIHNGSIYIHTFCGIFVQRHSCVGYSIQLSLLDTSPVGVYTSTAVFLSVMTLIAH